MSAQTKYGYNTAIGDAGGIMDLAPCVINSFANEADTGVLKFGVGVVKGTAAGNKVKLPEAESKTADFEGIVVNRRTTEYDLEGKIHIRKNSTVGVMRYGRIYGRIATGATPAYGDPVYMVASGEEAGYFTNVAENGITVNAQFVTSVDVSAQVAGIELYAPVMVQPAAAAASEG